MAEGQDLIVFENPVYDVDDDDDDGQEVDRGGPPEIDRTWAFEPGAASTPGEQYGMQTMMHEQSGLHNASYEETPLMGAQSQQARSWDALTHLFPRASATDLETSYSASGRLQVKKAGFGKKAYFLFTTDRSTKQEKLNPSLTKEIKDALGQSAEQIIAEDRETIREQRQRLAEAEKQQRQAEALAAERGKQSQEIQNLNQQIERTQASIDALQEDQGSNLESEAQLNRLKQLKKNYKTDLEKKKKELAGLEKQAKDKEKIQAKVDREKKKLDEIERERNTIEERLNSTKRLDELEDDEGRLKKLNEEDQAIIDDVYASEFDKDAARERMAARDEDLLRLNAQISERENSLSLRERIKAIFKKYGVTLTSILLAAGVTIGAVIGTITNALKKLGTELGNGLKTLGAKAASALPGLIGAIVTFLFKAAGSAIGFLAEHTWLLILAVVAFLFQKLMKRR